MKGRALLAWNLRRLRAERGISQERLAHDAGVDRAHVSGIERKVDNPTVDLLDKLSKVLDAPIGEFFREPKIGERKPQPLRGGRKPTAGTSR